MRTRRTTRRVTVGNLFLGGDSPIRVQGMTNVHTRSLEACLEQVHALIERGCELVRLAVPRAEDTAALRRIVEQVDVPIVADVHFQYRRALEAIEAGAAKIRLNPGNVRERRQVEQVIAACKANGCAIRVGVNEGSLPGRLSAAERRDTPELVRRMMETLQGYVEIFEANRFENLVLSVKSHDVRCCLAAYRAASRRFDYPLHLGLTHAGDPLTGSVRSAAALGVLLAEGIGDTLRISLAGDPLTEIEVGWELLTSLGLRPRRHPQLIACPTCGRMEIDLLAMVRQVKTVLQQIAEPITVAVMGCVVNGPGEAEGADVALCGGRDKVVIYRAGQKVAVVPAEQAAEALLEQIHIFCRRSERDVPS
ncbi:MAG: flavodoxin-dependent (E)-4-hydroxy-3-methylbut-2-enyl-diphosphate synthase [Sedimentisphaerales bacterium]|nr:flavodoxin-dependent (E)-4-hydroxy-3-methylbut-2-enyl-diphosphate synthase [Sedimentisphaerales bacterium]